MSLVSSQNSLTRGFAGADGAVAMFRVTVKEAVHPFALDGACVIATATPACGFSTSKPTPKIDVTPAGIRSPIPIVLLTTVDPEHTRLSLAIAQLLAAPGNKGATCPASAPVTLIPLIVTGALVVHAHCVGHAPDPVSPQLPTSCTDIVTPGRSMAQSSLSSGMSFALKSVFTERKVAIQPFARLGACSRLTETPG
jgi:hypothetical protein